MDRAIVFEKLQAIVAKTFGVDPGDVTEATTADDVDGWDSLAHATLIMRIEKTFNIQLDVAAASEAHDLGALTDAIAASAQ